MYVHVYVLIQMIYPPFKQVDRAYGKWILQIVYSSFATLSMFAVYNRPAVGTEYLDYLTLASVNFDFDFLRK